MLVIDEHGDRKWGTKTAHVGRQYLGNIGKVENGVVSVSSLWADEDVYYPVDVEPYSPAHHFQKGKADPAFRTKQQLPVELARRAKEAGLPFRAVVADAFYGKEAVVQQGLATALAAAGVLFRSPSRVAIDVSIILGFSRQLGAAVWKQSEFMMNTSPAAPHSSLTTTRTSSITAPSSIYRRILEETSISAASVSLPQSSASQ